MLKKLSLSQFVEHVVDENEAFPNQSEQNDSDSIVQPGIQIDEQYKNILLNKNEALNKISKETLLVIVDTHKKNYVEVPELLEKTNRIVVIDHHRKSPDFIENTILTLNEVVFAFF